MKIAIQTLGCKVNQSESASIEGLLKNSNYQIVDPCESPDICIVNTCTVTAKSDYQSRQVIRKALRSGAKVIATGCYAQLRPEKIAEIEGVSSIIGNSRKNEIIDHIESVIMDEGKSTILVDNSSSPLSIQPYSSDRARAFLKIQDGCSLRCSYCAVPLARGDNRSLTEKEVLESAVRLADDGYNEIVLTGIHTGTYGIDLRPKSSLLKIVHRIVKKIPHVRLRLSSIEPHEFHTDFLELINEGKVCRHLHIPLQSGSDKILRAMNRGYTADFFAHLINTISTKCQGISIGTDLIVGFPGETENDFYKTVKLTEQLSFSYLHVFPYSKRPDTKASMFENHIDSITKKKRLNKLLVISDKLKYNYKSMALGSILNVIIEGNSNKNSCYNAISDNYLRVNVISDGLTAGERINVMVISLTDKELFAEPCE